MAKKCCIFNCRLQKDDPGCLNLNFFKVPKDEKTRKEWANSIKNYFKTVIEFKKCSYVCAKHFEAECFNYGGLCKVVRLKKGSCPTIFEEVEQIASIQNSPSDLLTDDENMKCFHCPQLLTNEASHLSLVDKKTRGGLIKPSDDLIKVCQILEKNFRLYYKSTKGMFRQMCLNMTWKIPKNLLPIDHTENPKLHRSYLLRHIIIKYLQIRTKHYQQQQRQATKKIRRTFTKLILFHNQ